MVLVLGPAVLDRETHPSYRTGARRTWVSTAAATRPKVATMILVICILIKIDYWRYVRSDAML